MINIVRLSLLVQWCLYYTAPEWDTSGLANKVLI
jgi:hypothetical protein